MNVSEILKRQEKRMKCEKCGKEIKRLKINMFGQSGDDFDTNVDILENEYGNVIFIVDKNWTGYELTEEERVDTIMCPHCGQFPLKDEEIQVYDEVKVVMFKENYLYKAIQTTEELSKKKTHTLELPCLVGDTVYWLKREVRSAARIFKLEVEYFELRKELNFKARQKDKHGSLYTFYVNDDWNINVFATKEDAERKAKELNLVIFE